ncbi:MAG: hypothetical protein HY329_02840 [Chloroflexi bacterium]|nr:hypothetical protein [Chloroflexota bacterium]
MLDAVALEKRGVPTVTFVTEPFETAARAQAAARGYPDLPLIIVPHEFTWEAREQIERKIEVVLPDVVRQLTQQAPVRVESSNS